MLKRILAVTLLCCFCCVGSLAASENGAVNYVAKTDPDQSGLDQDSFDKDFSDQDGQAEVLIADPLITWNRGVFWVNDKLYFYLIKPVAKGYRYSVPKTARSSVKNFFANLATPIRAGNDLLQLKFLDFSAEVYRLIVNSTLGIGGLFDPAESLINIRKKENDFGLTLGYYGFGPGFYLVLPVIGPSSLRDATGGMIDTFLDPMKYAELRTSEYLSVQTFKTINWLSLDPDSYEGVIRDSIDPYLFLRAAYAQRRMAQIGKSDYTIDMLNIFDGTDFDFDIVNPIRWLGE